MKLDLSKYKTQNTTPSDINSASAALANSTHLNMQIASGKLDLSKYKKTTEQPNMPGDLGKGIVKGALKTATGIGTLFSKGLSHLPGKFGQYFKEGASEGESLLNDQNSPLAPTSTEQKIGEGAEQIAEWFVPAGEVGKIEKILSGGAKKITTEALTKAGLDPKIAGLVSKVASVGTKMAVRSGEGGAIIGAQTGGKDAGTGAKIGAVIPGIGGALGVVKNLAGGALKRLAGAATGRGTAVIDEILKDPRAALQGLSGKSVDVLSKDANTLKEAVVGMKAEAGKEYNRVLGNLQNIYEQEGKSFDKGTEINKVTDLLKEKFGIMKAGERAEQEGVTTEDAGQLDFESSRFLPKEATIIERALNILKSFKDPLSPKTIESLASKIDKLKSMSPSAIEVNSAVHTITSSLRESVAKMGEESGYKEGADIARNYAKAMDKIENFTGLFKATPEDLRPESGSEVSKIGEARKGEPVILTDTEKTKIASDLSTIFSGNKDIDKDILRNSVFGGQEILSREAGRTLATAPEKASSKLGDFIREMIITPLISPKRIGQIAAYTGIAEEKLPGIIEKLKGLSTGARAAITEHYSSKE